MYVKYIRITHREHKKHHENSPYMNCYQIILHKNGIGCNGLKHLQVILQFRVHFLSIDDNYIFFIFYCF